MNILNLSRTMGQGGAEKVVLDLCENTSMLFENTLVLSSGGVNVTKLKDFGVRHIEIPDLNSKRITDIIKTVKIIYKAVKDYDIDIIHSHHRMGAFYAQFIRKINKNIKLIYTAHNIFNDKKLLTKLSLNKTKVIAVGEGVKNNLVEFFNISNNNIEIINNSVKPSNTNEYIRPKECCSSKIIITCIGRLSEQKGIKYLIDAISIIKKIQGCLNFKVLIIGDGEIKGELQKQIYNLELYDVIELLGYKSNVYEYIKFSDFIVSSSLWEGFPLTPIECFAVGKTIIATDIVGNNEIVIDNYNGLLVEARNIENLANTIIKLLNNRRLLEFLENNAKKSYVKNYSYDEYMKKYIKIYKNYIDK